MHYRVRFEYRAEDREKWRKKEGIFYGTDSFDALQRCKIIHGLGVFYDYKIIYVEKVD